MYVSEFAFAIYILTWLKKTGLFAVTVAAFIIEGYKRLSSDSAAATVLLLNQISQQLSALSNGTQDSTLSPPLYSDSSFRPAPSAIRINILWFLSLVLSLICALAATLIQQWSRQYRQLPKTETTLYKRARIRAYLFEGVENFGLPRAVGAVTALLHVAVFLFFAGLIDFLFSIDSTVGRVILGVMCSFGAIYTFLTFLPNIRPNCPYRTPFSRDSLKWLLVVSMTPALLAIQCLNYFIPIDKLGRIRTRFLLFMRSLQWTMSGAILSLREDIDRRALRGALATVDDDDDIERLIKGIPEFLKAGTSTNAFSIVDELLDVQPISLGHHIERLIQTCTADSYRGVNENLRRRRALACLDTVRTLTVMHSTSFSYEKFGGKTWPSVYLLERDKDPIIAVNAISTGALAACAYLHSVFTSRGQAPKPTRSEMLTHVMNLCELVNAPWHEADLDSFPGCHLLVLQGFVSSLFPYLKRDKATLTGFHVVWETLPRILGMAPLGHSTRRSRETFLAIWEELKNLPGTERAIDTNDLPPIVQLMSMLRPTAESIRVQQARNKRLRTIIRTKVIPGIRSRAIGLTSSAPATA